MEVSQTTDIQQFIKVSALLFNNPNNNTNNYGIHYNYYKDEESIEKFFSKENPYWQHAEYKLLIATENNEPVARMAIIIDQDYNSYYIKKNQKTVFFGFFETKDDFQITKALFKEAKKILKKQKCTKFLGPIDGNMFNNIGLLQNNFSLIPEISMPINPAYYLEHFAKLKLKKHIDLLAYTIYLPNCKNVNQENLSQQNQSKQNKNDQNLDIQIIGFKKQEFDSKLKTAFQIYSEAYGKTNHWLYYPIKFEEFYYQVGDLRQVLDEELTLIINYKNIPVGFLYCIPNFNLIIDKITAKSKLFQTIQFLWYKRKIKEARLALICILPNDEHKGFGTIIAQQLIANLKKKGYTTVEYSWVLETNTASRHLAEKLGGKIKSIYRVYEMKV